MLEAQILAEIGYAVGSSVDFEDMAKKLADKLGSLLEFDRVGVVTVDPSQRTASKLFSYPLSAFVPEHSDQPSWDLDGTFIGEAINLRRPVNLGDHNRSEFEASHPILKESVEAGLRSKVVVPIIHDDTVIAAFDVSSTSKPSYNDYEVELIIRVAGQIGPALINASLHQQTAVQGGLRLVLAEIGRIVTSSPDLDSVFDPLAEQVKRVIQYDRIGIALIDDDGNSMIPAFQSGTEVDGIDNARRIPMHDSMSHQAIESKMPTTYGKDELLAQFGSNDLLKVIIDKGLTSVLISPLIWQNEVIGVLSLRRRDPRPFSPHELEIVSQISAQISGAAENARLLRRMAKQGAEDATLADLSRIISSSTSVDEVYEPFVERLRDLVDFDRAVIAILQTDGQSFVDAHVHGIERSGWEQGKEHPLSGSITESIIARGTAELATTETLAEFIETYPAASLSQGDVLRSLISAPLMWQEKPVGALHLQSETPNAYSSDDVRILDRVSSQIAGAVATSNLHSETVRDFNRRAMLAEIARTVSGPLSLDEISDQVRRQLSRVMKFDRFGVSSYDPKTDLFHNFFACDFQGHSQELTADNSLSISAASGFLASFKALAVGPEELAVAYANNPHLKPLQEAGIRSRVTIPLRWNDRLVGAFAIASKSPVPPDPDQIAVLEQVASHIAGAMVASRLHEDTVRQSKSREFLAELSRVVGSSLEIETIATSMVNQLKEIMVIDRVSIAAINIPKQTVTTIWNNVDSFDPAFGKGVERDFSDAFLKRAIEERSTLAVHAGSSESTDSDDPPDIGFLRDTTGGPERTYLLAPMWLGDEPIGYLYLRSYGWTSYFRDDASLLEEVAAQIAPILQNSRLQQAAIDESDRRSDLAEISRIFSSDDDLHDIYERFIGIVQKIIPFDRMVISELDVAGDWMTDEFVWGAATKELPRNRTMVLSRTHAARVVKEDRSIVLNSGEILIDAEGIPGGSEGDRLGLGSALITPLKWRNKIIGTLNFRAFRDNSYGDEETVVAEQLANQIAGAVENARLHQRTRDEALERTVLAEISRVASSSLDTREIYESLSTQIGRLVRFDRMTITLVDEDQDIVWPVFVGGIRLSEVDQNKSLPLGESSVGEVISADAAVVANRDDVERMAARSDMWRPILVGGLISGLYTPLRWRGKIIGTLDFRSKEENAFGERDVRITSLISDQIVGTIVNARMYEDVTRSEEEQTVLADIGRIASSSLDIDEIYEAFSGQAARLISFDRMAITAVNGMGRARIAFSTGLQTRKITNNFVFPPEGSTIEMARNAEAPLVLDQNEIENLASRYDAWKTVAEAGLISALIVPLRWKGQELGSIDFRSRSEHAFGDREVRLASQIVDQVVGAIANSHLHENVARSEEEQTVLAEIGRVASSSHDIGEIYEELLVQAARLIHFDRMTITRIDKSQGTARPDFVGGMRFNGIVEGTPFLLHESSAGMVIEADDAIVLGRHDIEKMAARFKRWQPLLDSGLISALHVPLRWRDQIIGSIDFRSTTKDAFRDQEIRIGTLISDQIVGTIANSRLHIDLARSEQEQIMLAEIGRTVSSSLDIGAVYERFAQQARHLIEFDRLVITRINSQRSDVIPQYIYGVPVSGIDRLHPPDYNLSATRRAAESGETVVLRQDEVLQLSKIDPGWKALVKAKLITVMVVPLSWQGDVVGSLVFRAMNPDAYDQRSIRIGALIADQIVGAVVNSELHDDISRSEVEQAALAEMGRIVTSSVDVIDVYEELTDIISRVLPYDRLVISSVDPDAASLKHVYIKGAAIPGYEVGRAIDLAESRLRAMIDRRHSNRRDSLQIAVEQDDLSNSGNREAWDAGLRSNMLVLLEWQQDVIGVLGLRSNREDAYGEAEIGLAERIAAQISGAMANSRLHQNLQQESAERASLAEIGRVISSNLEISAVYERFAEEAKKLIPFDRVVFSEIDENTKSSVLAYISGVEIPEYSVGIATPVDRVLLSNPKEIHATTVTDYAACLKLAKKYPGYATALEYGLKSAMQTPLIWQERVIGVLAFRSKEDSLYTPRHKRLANEIATQISGAIENARLHKRTQEEALERTVLAEIGRIASSTLETGDIYDELSDQTARLIHFDRMVISQINRDRNYVTPTFISGETVGNAVQGSAPFPISESPTSLVVEADGPVRMVQNDIEKMSAQFDSWKPVLDAGLISALYVPLRWHNEIIGSLDFRAKTEHAYSDRDTRVATLVADQIVGTIANSELHDNVARSESEQTALAELGRKVSEAETAVAIFEALDAAITRFMKTDRISISTLNQASMVLESRYWRGLEIPGVGTGTGLPLEDTMEEFAAWATLKPTDNPTLLRTPLSSSFMTLKLRTTMRVPMRTRDHHVGVIAVNAERAGAFSESDFQLLARMGEQVASALENLDLFSAAQAETRERTILADIGRIVSSSLDIHDVFEGFVASARELLPADRAVISLIDVDADTITDAFTWGVKSDPHPQGFTAKFSETPVPEMLASSKSITWDEEQIRASALERGVQPVSDRMGLKSLLFSPLFWRRELIGTLNFRSTSPAPYTPDQLRIADQIAAQIAGAIANGRLHENLRIEAEERTALAEIGRIANSSLRLEDTYDALAAMIGAMVPFDRMAIGTVDKAVSTIEYVFATGRSADQSVPGRVVPLDDLIFGTDPIGDGHLIQDASKDESQLARYMRPLGVRSVISVPVVGRGELLSILTISSLEPDRYIQRDLETIRRVAAQIAGAIANAEMHTRTIQLAGEREKRIRVDAQNSELREIERERANFISTISHELRTPLTSVTAFTDLLSRNTKGNLDERQLVQIGLVKKNARRLGIIINDLFDVTRINSGTFEITPGEFDVIQLMSEIHQSMLPILLEKNQGLILEAPDGELWIKADRDRLAQVTTNLLSNASKYSPDETNVTLTLSVKKDDLLIAVTDQGIGISKRDQRLLFTPFFRADNEETRKVDGTGLGLMVTRKIVEMHNGEVTVESQEGKGSTFTVILPGVQNGPSDEHIAQLKAQESGPIPHSRLDNLPNATTPPIEDPRTRQR